jgi:hypothetical protein
MPVELVEHVLHAAQSHPSPRTLQAKHRGSDVKDLADSADQAGVRTVNRAVIQREPIVPWVAASTLVSAAYAVGVLFGLADNQKSRVALTIALCSIITATALVMHRSRAVVEDEERSQRARPASDELASWASERTLVTTAAAGSGGNLPPYGAGMLEYSGVVIELLEHAVGAALKRAQDTTELASARDDAAALNDLLKTMASEPVQLHKAAKVHTICSLWEADQDRIEKVAADLDPEFHRRWRARNLATLRLRHGQRPARTDTALPYQEVSTLN